MATFPGNLSLGECLLSYRYCLTDIHVVTGFQRYFTYAESFIEVKISSIPSVNSRLPRREIDFVIDISCDFWYDRALL